MEVYNISVKDAGIYTSHESGHHAVVFTENSYNNTVHDLVSDGTGWSSIQYSYPTHDIYFYNCTVYRSGHNGIDMHGGYNQRGDNITVHGWSCPDGNNIIVCFAHDSRLTNISSYDAGAGCGMSVSETASNFTCENYYCHNASTGIKTYGTSAYGEQNNTTIINMTSDDVEFGAQITNAGRYSYNTTIIDSNITSRNKCGAYDLFLEQARDTNLINCKYTTSLYGTDSGGATYYYYPNLIVKNSQGQCVANATITTNTTARNGYGRIQSSFITDENGKLYSNGNRSNWLAIPYTNVAKTTSSSYITDITVTKNPDGRKVSLSGITPDSSWYRKDPNVPTYTITAQIPDISSKGPHIIGFAPSIDNPFNPGEKKNFRVWVDGSLTNVTNMACI